MPARLTPRLLCRAVQAIMLRMLCDMAPTMGLRLREAANQVRACVRQAQLVANFETVQRAGAGTMTGQDCQDYAVEGNASARTCVSVCAYTVQLTP